MFSQNNNPKEFLDNFITFLNENNKSKVSYNCFEELLKKFNNKKDFLVNKKLQTDLIKFISENKIAGFGEHSIVSEKSINDFLLIEDSIDNLELFWILFGLIVLRDRFSSNRLYDYKKIIFKKNRLSIGLYIRSLLANFMFVGIKPSLVFGGIKKILEKKLFFFWNSYFENIEEEDEITIFRGFILNKGKIIRNPKIKDKQLEGSGICYSINREVAVSFATTINPYLDLVGFFSKSLINEENNFLNLDKKSRKKIINNKTYKSLLKQIKLEKEKRFAEDLLDNKPLVLQDDLRSIVGKYKVKKKDIIIISNNRVSLSGIVLQEHQVVCFPEFTSLKRYDYVNHNEFLKINSQIKTEEQLIKIFSKKRIND